MIRIYIMKFIFILLSVYFNISKSLNYSNNLSDDNNICIIKNFNSINVNKYNTKKIMHSV